MQLKAIHSRLYILLFCLRFMKFRVASLILSFPALLFLASLLSNQYACGQTQIDVGTQTGTYVGFIRGYHFTAPTNFTICELYVPDDINTEMQHVQVVRFTAGPPPSWPTTTNNFDSLFYQNNWVPNTPIPCSITINNGDVIGVYGARGNGTNMYNSYGASPYATTVYGSPMDLTRSFMQFPLNNQQMHDISTSAGALGRVIMYYDCAAPPVANFNSNTTITCSGDIDFYDLSSNIPTSWKWYFGDGDSAMVQNPSHTYLLNGTYDVTLIACNMYGCDTLTLINYITVNTWTPIPASCTPVTLNYCCGFGITDVSFNTINNPSGDAINGYEDFTCSQTTLTEGQVYSISITTSQPSEHNIRAWIDFNNDGAFNNITELVFSADQVFIGNGSVFIPPGTTLNTPLRMRISADYYLDPVPTPCLDLERGQAEDYTVTILPNTNPPVAEFSADDTLSCSGNICFTDESLNLPIFWYWQFPGGNPATSSIPTPCVSYPSDGVYTVTLIVTNAYGSDTIVKQNYINVTLGGPVAAACIPNTLAACCNYGITNVVFNTISNATNGGEDDYQDYSCTHSTTVFEGNAYLINVLTGPDNPEDVNVWIDYDNDGTLDDITELVFTSSNDYQHAGGIGIPFFAVIGAPLRMRVSSDFVGNPLTSCSSPFWGQTEDYAVTIVPEITPLFVVDSPLVCLGTVQFTDQSGGNPIAWFWDFGDGNTDTVQHPQHTYANNGTYTIKLVVSNLYIGDSLTIFNYVTVDSSICADIGISSDYSNDKIAIFPNPSEGSVTINYLFDGVKNINIALQNIIGQEMFSEEFTGLNVYNKTLDLSTLPKGIYFLTMDDGEIKMARKIILH